MKDPELRFFLALLLNLPSRTWIYRVIERTFPGSAPETLFYKWLKRLRDQESLSNAFFELAKKANVGGDILGARLKAAVQFGLEDPRTEVILRAAVTGTSPQDLGVLLQETFGDRVALPKALDAYARLRQMIELEPLFVD